jgi:hypothetical protein
VIVVMVHREGTLVERVPERGEGEERVRVYVTVPGGDAAPAASGPAKKATRQKRLSDGTPKPAVTSNDGTAARRQGTAARGRRRASTASSSDGAGTSTEGGADSSDPEDLLDEDGRLKEPQSEASRGYRQDEWGPEPCDPRVF